MTLRARHLPLIAGAGALTTLLAACGGSSGAGTTDIVGNDATPTSPMTVEVAMEDIKFDTTTLTVTAGETIDFRFTNTGKIAHDAFIGDAAAQMEHEVEMSDASAHPMEEAAIVLQPGESGELSYTFDLPGTYQIGCHQPGHYAAGMKIQVTVE